MANQTSGEREEWEDLDMDVICVKLWAWHLGTKKVAALGPLDNAWVRYLRDIPYIGTGRCWTLFRKRDWSTFLCGCRVSKAAWTVLPSNLADSEMITQKNPPIFRHSSSTYICMYLWYYLINHFWMIYLPPSIPPYKDPQNPNCLFLSNANQRIHHFPQKRVIASSEHKDHTQCWAMLRERGP